MTKINKTAARKLYNEGKPFIIVACNFRPESGIRFKPEWKNIFRDFDALVNHFEYYNCRNGETGRRAAYYVED